MNIQKFISEKITNILVQLNIDLDNSIFVCPSSKSIFGDYQINGIISLSKTKNISANYLAKKIVSYLHTEDFVYKIEISSSYFINIFLNKEWISQHIEKHLKHKKLGISILTKQTVVVDYSSPNIAKQMHVGHLRSTIIGDSIARGLRFLGHKVIRVNHIGDWGTNIGMLIAYHKKIQQQNFNKLTIFDLENMYCKAKKIYDNDTIFADISRKYVVKLQSGDEYCRKIWYKIVNLSIKKNQQIYKKLNVTLGLDNVYGESYYNDMLPSIVADLIQKGIAVKDNGAIVVYLNEFKNKNGEPFGLVIKKKDGGYLYSTIDIACIKYRYEKLHADRIIYCTDSRQNQHLMQIYSIARKANYIPKSILLEHYMFGMMLDKNKKPFKTRDGNVILLDQLLDEAISRATIFLKCKHNNIPKNMLNSIINAIAIGSIKYFDLSKNRMTSYVFDWNKMLTFEGNTAPYMQYMYVRVASIFKKVNINLDRLSTNHMIISNKYEYMLAVCLLQFEENLLKVVNLALPHILCNYLYKLAGIFSSFYEFCPILTTEDYTIKESRLKLAFLTQKTIKIGLNILGIRTVEIM